MTPLLLSAIQVAVLAARSLMTNHLEEGSPTAGCVLGILCVQNHMGSRYGPAKSRTENLQVMGRAGETHGNCRCGPPLPDELQKSWQYIYAPVWALGRRLGARGPFIPRQ